VMKANAKARSAPAVLVVDDDKAIRAFLSEVLADEGFRVKTAVNGRTALDLLATGFRPCVILLDLMMPVANGWDFRSRQLRMPDVSAIPVAVLSGSNFSAESLRIQFGDVGVFDKPILLPPLLQFVRSHCA